MQRYDTVPGLGPAFESPGSLCAMLLESSRLTPGKPVYTTGRRERMWRTEVPSQQPTLSDISVNEAFLDS